MEVLVSLLLSVLQAWFGFGGVPPTEEVFLGATTTAQVVRVIDGDTIVVEHSGAEHTVRYIGMDTPEPYRDGEPACYSAEATARNKELVSGIQVVLVADVEDADKYGRLLRYVYAQNILVNEVLVREGFATTMTIKPNTRMKDLFSQAEINARTERTGLWKECQR